MRDTRRQTIIGTVISNKMDKTVVVQVETLKQHPDYKKYVRKRKNFKAHDEKNSCELGDVVRCMETRPISKEKRWRVVEVVRKHYTSTLEVEDPDFVILKKKRAEAHKARQAARAAEAAAAEKAEAEEEQEDEQAQEAPEEKVEKTEDGGAEE